jgi:uncharacterized protein YcaQ
MKLSLRGARALMLAAQGLHIRPEEPVSKDAVLATIRRMEGLQIDTISVVARSPYLVLWSRLGAYEPRWLDELLAEGALFEYWSHAACFLPIEDFPFYRGRMLHYANGDGYLNGRSPEQREVIDRILDRIREGGAVRSIEFTRDGGKGNGWWDWKPEKWALEHLFNAGVLMIARRERFQRVYDLRERVLPEWDDARLPSAEETRVALTLKAVQALGVAPARWVLSYFPGHLRTRATRRDTEDRLRALLREGSVISVAVEGWNEDAYVHRDHASLAEQAAAGALDVTRTTLLSPFDPIVRDRKRAAELFGFEYRIETYTPAARRRYGYFSLPILHHGSLVGRLDPKAHRKEGLFEVKALHLEPGVPVTDELVTALAGALRDCAAWHQTPEVVVRHSDPPQLATRLNALLERKTPLPEAERGVWTY